MVKPWIFLVSFTNRISIEELGGRGRGGVNVKFHTISVISWWSANQDSPVQNHCQTWSLLTLFVICTDMIGWIRIIMFNAILNNIPAIVTVCFIGGENQNTRSTDDIGRLFINWPDIYIYIYFFIEM